MRPGWRLIGYDLRARPRPIYFAYIAPEPEHVHLGFEHGVLMDDPQGLLEGGQLGLRKVRYVTVPPAGAVRAPELERLVREAARVAGLPPDERLALAADRELRASRNP